MIKRILVILDNSAPGMKAQAFALNFAKAYNASLTGLAVLDTPWIAAVQSTPLGGSSFRSHRNEIVTQHSHQQLTKLCDDFKQHCHLVNVTADTQIAEGFPAIEIEKSAQEHDLIIMGKTNDFHFDLEEDSDTIVKHVVKDNPRPVILVPETIENSDGDIMIAYDGSLQAARSLHIFLLLGIGHGKKLHIVSGDKLADKAAVIAKRAEAMCLSHGYEVTIHSMAFEGSHPDQLLNTIHDLKPSLLVMGGFSHTIVREALFGSSTKTLMKQSPVPIFIHH